VISSWKQYLARLRGSDPGGPSAERDAKGRLNKRRNASPQFNLREELFRDDRYGLTQIDGIDVTVAMTVVSKVGWDMSKWKTRTIFFWLKRLQTTNQWAKSLGKVARSTTTARPLS